MLFGFRPTEHVGQDDILRAGWQPALGGSLRALPGRVLNPPQVANLPHNLCRVGLTPAVEGRLGGRTSCGVFGW